MDIYRLRQTVPGRWPEDIQQWARHCLLSGSVPAMHNRSDELSPELDAIAALELWLPLERVATSDDGEPDEGLVLHADPTAGRCIIAWPDGTVHIGVSPRVLEDLAAIYRHARIVMEYAHSATTARRCDQDERLWIQ